MRSSSSSRVHSGDLTDEIKVNHLYFRDSESLLGRRFEMTCQSCVVWRIMSKKERD